MLYWRTDLMPSRRATCASCAQLARDCARRTPCTFGLVWQGARYEGLVTVFLEYLGGFGGAILDEAGAWSSTRRRGDARARRHARRDRRDGIVPPAVLTWQEEQARFAFQNGEAAFMRNWPYA